MRVTSAHLKREQIADAIEAQVRAGVYGLGQALPSRRDLAGEHGVAPDTVTDAVRELERRGLVVSLPGAGTYVVDVLPAPGAHRTDRERLAALEARMDAVERRLS